MVDHAEAALEAAAARATRGALDVLPDQAAPRPDAGRVIDLAPDRVLSRLDAIVTGPHAASGLEHLRDTGLLRVLLPEVDRLHGFHDESEVRHKDLWSHTLEVVERTVADPDLRWAALLHDVGKTATRAVDERGRITFHRHERVGAVWARGIGHRLGMAPGRIDRIAFVIEHHARVNAYRPGWTDRAVRRLVREAGPRLGDLLDFSSADFTTRRREKASRIRRHLDDLRARIAAVEAEDGLARSGRTLPRGLGAEVARALGLPRGPERGEVMAWLRDEVEAGRLPAGASAEVYVQAALARHRDRGSR